MAYSDYFLLENTTCKKTLQLHLRSNLYTKTQLMWNKNFTNLHYGQSLPNVLSM